LGLSGGSTSKGEETASSSSKPVVVAVCGGSGSGKTTLTEIIMEKLGEENCVLIAHDSYYKNFNSLSLEQRAAINFDSPEALDSELLAEHLDALRNNRPAKIPIYDFATHSRRLDTHTLALPKRIVLVEGILIFTEACKLLDLFDVRIFVDTPDDIRLIRRLKRDMLERERTMDSVIHQYFATVRPMHEMLVEPSKRHAQIIVPSTDGIKDEAVDMVVSRLRDLVK